MKTQKRLRIAVQKSGRLNNDSMDLLYRCGVKIRVNPNALYCHSENLPIDVLFVRDDDIPTLVMDGICDLGIVGENVLLEQSSGNEDGKLNTRFSVVKKLGFSRCRLSIAVPNTFNFENTGSLHGLRIATSYPGLLRQYLKKNNVDAGIMPIAGSVEIAPRLGMADAICDLVATGRTLEENNLKEVVQVLHSQAVLIKPENEFQAVQLETMDLLLRRMEGVLKAQESKYIMFHAPRTSISALREILPGCETPTVIGQDGDSDKVVVHVVSPEGVFWDTLENLKKAGASSILVLPIEKMMA